MQYQSRSPCLPHRKTACRRALYRKTKFCDYPPSLKPPKFAPFERICKTSYRYGHPKSSRFSRFYSMKPQRTEDRRPLTDQTEACRRTCCDAAQARREPTDKGQTTEACRRKPTDKKKRAEERKPLPICRILSIISLSVNKTFRMGRKFAHPTLLCEPLSHGRMGNSVAHGAIYA